MLEYHFTFQDHLIQIPDTELILRTRCHDQWYEQIFAYTNL